MLISPVSYRQITMHVSNNLQSNYTSNLSFERKQKEDFNISILDKNYISVQITDSKSNKMIGRAFFGHNSNEIEICADNNEVRQAAFDSLLRYIKENRHTVKFIVAKPRKDDKESVEFYKHNKFINKGTINSAYGPRILCYLKIK